MAKSRYGRWHGVSDEWGSAICEQCGRRINLNKRGYFRRHKTSAHDDCPGSLETPAQQQAAQQMLAVDWAKPGSEFTVIAKFENGELVSRRVIPPSH